jgi:isopentenyl phosphate kinase
MASAGESAVVVHGGGSFGHVVAKQSGLSSDAAEASASGVSRTRAAMYELTTLVCKTMSESKLNPYPFAPFDAVARAGKTSVSQWLRGLLKAGLTPVTFGDVVLAPRGFKVMSGDVMVQELVKLLKPERCIFALDVDGVYQEDTRLIIPELTPSRIRKMRVSRGDDATGGIRLKLEVAAKVAAAGTKVCFVSGYRRNEFSKALKGLDFYGTVVHS